MLVLIKQNKNSNEVYSLTISWNCITIFSTIINLSWLTFNNPFQTRGPTEKRSQKAGDIFVIPSYVLRHFCIIIICWRRRVRKLNIKKTELISTIPINQIENEWKVIRPASFIASAWLRAHVWCLYISARYPGRGPLSITRSLQQSWETCRGMQALMQLFNATL